VLRSFIASCKRPGVEPVAWFRDVLSHIPPHSITKLSDLLPHNWTQTSSPSQALLVQREMDSGRSLLASIQPFRGLVWTDTVQCSRGQTSLVNLQLVSKRNRVN
jgi:hypothetical protein